MSNGRFLSKTADYGRKGRDRRLLDIFFIANCSLIRAKPQIAEKPAARTAILTALKKKRQAGSAPNEQLAMGPQCGQLALAVGNVPALRVHCSFLIEKKARPTNAGKAWDLRLMQVDCRHYYFFV
jgi:hypothetical protein